MVVTALGCSPADLEKVLPIHGKYKDAYEYATRIVLSTLLILFLPQLLLALFQMIIKTMIVTILITLIITLIIVMVIVLR